MTEPKKCIDCGREKPITEFYTNGILNGKERHRPECKQCHILRVMKDYKRKPPLEKKCIYIGDLVLWVAFIMSPVIGILNQGY